MSRTQQPRPVPEAGITWSRYSDGWGALVGGNPYPVWTVTEEWVQSVLAGREDAAWKVAGTEGEMTAGEIIRRAFGPADHECPGASCDVPWCDHAAADTAPATRAIAARDLREGMFWRCNLHFHEIVRRKEDGACIRLALAPVAGCELSLEALHRNDDLAIIRADQAPQRDTVPERCLHSDHDTYPGQRCRGCGVVAATPKRPTYRIPARDVVPGMLLPGEPQGPEDPGWSADGRDIPITRVTVQPSGYRVIASLFAAAPDELVTVRIPGPSPRLCCTCSSWHWLAMAATGSLTTATPIVAVAPLLHRADCLVAPRPGVHGGMRLWPAPVRMGVWEYSDAGEEGAVWEAGADDFATVAIVYPSEILYAGHTGGSGFADLVLGAFFHPPAQPEPTGDRAAWERHRAERTAGVGGWDPYDVHGGDER